MRMYRYKLMVGWPQFSKWLRTEIERVKIRG